MKLYKLFCSTCIYLAGITILSPLTPLFVCCDLFVKLCAL